MRKISRSTRFRKDYKREIKGQHRGTLDADLLEVFGLLANHLPLPVRFKDHALTENWKDHRDCRLRPDLVLIYRVPDPESLELIRLGSHSELGL